MKIKFILILSAFLCFSSICYGDSLKNSNKNCTTIFLNGGTPDSIAAKANKYSSFNPPPYAGILQDPVVNSTLGGYGNMIRGMDHNSYSAIEQQKEQADFSKQQIESPAD